MMGSTSDKAVSELINTVFHEKKHGLRFFENGEREKLKLRKQDGKIEIWCAKHLRSAVSNRGAGC